MKTTIEPVIYESKRGEVELDYVDAAHFVLGAFLGYLWSKQVVKKLAATIANVTMSLARTMRFAARWSP